MNDSSQFSNKSVPVLIGIVALSSAAIAIPTLGITWLARVPLATQPPPSTATTHFIKVMAIGRIEPVSAVLKVERADMRAMQVIAEVNESDIELVRIGQIAKITSRNQAFTDELWGQVIEIGTQISPNDRLSSDPSEINNTRMVKVKVRLMNSQSVTKFTNLQVDVKILVQPFSQPFNKSPN
jgi:hypothetical protein